MKNKPQENSSYVLSREDAYLQDNQVVVKRFVKK
jgi:hypothetical protein